MGRWQPDARNRLREAAMDLFSEHGFDQTTTAEIAERAGLTERTFFRHFTDKREVLFDGSQALEQQIVSAVASAPESSSPLELAAAGLCAGGEALEERRAFARRRQRIIAATPELQERELMKLSSLAEAMAAALQARGLDRQKALLSAEIGVAVFRAAFERWIAEGQRKTLPDVLREALALTASLASTK
jgi:AcrR family transcriptional regulator